MLLYTMSNPPDDIKPSYIAAAVRRVKEGVATEDPRLVANIHTRDMEDFDALRKMYATGLPGFTLEELPIISIPTAKGRLFDTFSVKKEGMKLIFFSPNYEEGSR